MPIVFFNLTFLCIYFYQTHTFLYVFVCFKLNQRDIAVMVEFNNLQIFLLRILFVV